MDSSNADPWEGFTGQSQADADDALITDPLVRQIGELRAAFGDSEARRAELEAVIEKVRELHDMMPGSEYRLSLGMVLAVAESKVLADRDREVAALALEDFADKWGKWIITDAPQVRGGAAYRARLEAAAIRKGDTNA